jgi:hypothetical protein
MDTCSRAFLPIVPHFACLSAMPVGTIAPGRPHAGLFPEVALAVDQIAGERPQELGRSWSPWDGTAIARQSVRDGMVSLLEREARVTFRLFRCRGAPFLLASNPFRDRLARGVGGLERRDVLR